MKTRWVVVAVLLIASALVWQHKREKAVADAKATDQLVTSLQLAPRILTHPDKQLEVFDAKISLTNDIPTRSDQRPIYMISGRIKNHTLYPVDEVWLEVDVFDTVTRENVDTALVKLEDLGLPNDESAISFSRTIQLLPPKNWGWSYQIVQAKTDPEFSDIDPDISTRAQ